MIDNGPIVSEFSFDTAAVNGEPDNEVFYLRWEFDIDTYSCAFTEEGIERAVFTDGALNITDSEGDVTSIQAFILSKLSF